MAYINRLEVNYTAQRGVFYFLLKKYQENNSTYVNVYSNPINTYGYVYTPIDDITPLEKGRFVAPRQDIYVHLSFYRVRLSHITVLNLKPYSYTKYWEVYDYSDGKTNCIANITVNNCDNKTYKEDVISFQAIDSNPLINTLVFRPGERSDNTTNIEVKSFEIYGDLYYYKAQTCKSSLHTHLIRMVFIFLYFHI